MNEDFWKNKRVLVTGHTGFKGGWLSLWLRRLGADVYGISLPPTSSPNFFEKASVEEELTHYIEDIRDVGAMQRCFSEIKPEIVFHLAAQSLVRYSYTEPKETYETNVIGTLNVLESIRAV